MWKCQPVESVEIPKRDFTPLPPALEIAPRFPHPTRIPIVRILTGDTRRPPAEVLPMSSVRNVTYVPGRTLIGPTRSAIAYTIRGFLQGIRLFIAP